VVAFGTLIALVVSVNLDDNFLQNLYIYGGKIIMSIGLWVAVTVVLGLAAMGLCFLFLKACEKI
jgi:hypothetical protein